MGAAAISCLAGSRLLALRPPHPLQRALGTTITALWLWATLLIPLLLAAGAWRHLRHRLPLAYEPALWCIVFPLGMYATATAHLLPTTAHPVAWTALAAWLAVSTRLLTTRP